MEGMMEMLNGIFITQASIWDILNDEEEEQIKTILRRISNEQGNKSLVKVTFEVKGCEL